MKTDNLSFTSKHLVIGKAPEMKELTTLIFEKMAAREAKFAKRKNIPEPLKIRVSDLSNDRFDYERKILFSTGDDIKEVEDIATSRSIRSCLNEKLPKLADEFKLPEKILGAKQLLKGIKDETIDIIEMLF